MELFRVFGPAHISLYGHADCAEALAQRIVSRGDDLVIAAAAVVNAAVRTRVQDRLSHHSVRKTASQTQLRPSSGFNFLQ
ncbi:MAG: hypothetical protein VX815_04505 [Gemmatimonadota bacterium]|nr:hypothetical protein [Gemmatimonadota bacterium]